MINTDDKVIINGDELTAEHISAAVKIIDKKLNLYQKIVEVRKVASGFYKDTRGFGFEYVSGNQILSKIRDKMNALNLILQPSVELGEHSNYEYKNAKGQQKVDFVVKGRMSYTWINGDEPRERETVEWAYYGQQDDISKAFGSGLTYSERYFLLKYFGLPTDEDEPDAKGADALNNKKPTQQKPTQQKPQQQAQSIQAAQEITPPPAAPKELSTAQIKRLYALGTAATFKEEQIKTQVQKRFGKTVSELSKSEYDLICNGYQAVINKMEKEKAAAAEPAQ